MKNMQSQLTAPSQPLAKVIHNPVVEKNSEVIGNIGKAKPSYSWCYRCNSLSRSIYSSRKCGYELSGFETIGLFILGWAIGAIIEYIRVGLINNGKGDRKTIYLF